MGLGEDGKHPQDLLSDVSESRESVGHNLSQLRVCQRPNSNTPGQLTQFLFDTTLPCSLSEEELKTRFRHYQTTQAGHRYPTTPGEGFQQCKHIMGCSLSVLNQQPGASNKSSGEKACLPDKLPWQLCAPVQPNQEARVCVVADLLVKVRQEV